MAQNTKQLGGKKQTKNYELKKREYRGIAKILAPECVFHKSKPIILGIHVVRLNYCVLCFKFFAVFFFLTTNTQNTIKKKERGTFRVSDTIFAVPKSTLEWGAKINIGVLSEIQGANQKKINFVTKQNTVCVKIESMKLFGRHFNDSHYLVVKVGTLHMFFFCISFDFLFDFV